MRREKIAFFLPMSCWIFIDDEKFSHEKGWSKKVIRSFFFLVRLAVRPVRTVHEVDGEWKEREKAKRKPRKTFSDLCSLASSCSNRRARFPFALSNVISEGKHRKKYWKSFKESFCAFCSSNLIILKLGRKQRRSWTERDSNNDLPLPSRPHSSLPFPIRKQHNRSVFERAKAKANAARAKKRLSAGKMFFSLLFPLLSYFSRVRAQLNEDDCDVQSKLGGFWHVNGSHNPARKISSLAYEQAAAAKNFSFRHFGDLMLCAFFLFRSFFSISRIHKTLWWLSTENLFNAEEHMRLTFLSLNEAVEVSRAARQWRWWSRAGVDLKKTKVNYRTGWGRREALIAWFLNMFFHPLSSINHWIASSPFFSLFFRVMKLRRECLMAFSTPLTSEPFN